MTVREILLPWDSQPQEAVFPAQRWVDQGLVFAYQGASSRADWGRLGIDVGGGHTTDGNTRPAAVRASALGVGGNYTGSTGQRWSVAGSDGNTWIANPKSVTLVSTLATDNLSDAQTALGLSSFGTVPLYRIFVSGGQIGLQLRDDSGAFINLFAGSLTAGDAVTVVARITAATSTVFVGGAVASDTTPAGSFTFYGPTLGYLARGAGVEQPWDGWLGDQFIFDTALTDEECLELRSNPFAVWEERRIWAPVSTAPAAPNITAVYADSVTTSSVTPRVTLDFA